MADLEEKKGSELVIGGSAAEEDSDWVWGDEKATLPVAEVDSRTAEPQTVGDSLRRLLFKNDMSDVTFIVGPKKEKVHAHRLVLGARSSVLRSMLYPWTPTQCQQPLPLEVALPDVTVEMLHVLLQFCYADKFDWTAATFKAARFFADKYHIQSLKYACDDFASGGFTVENVCALLDCFRGDAERSAITFILENADEVFHTPGFLAISGRHLAELVANDELNADELAIFHAVVSWGRAEVKRQGLTGDSLGKVLHEYLPLIRFPLMDSASIALEVAPLNLLSPTQLLEIYTYLGCQMNPNSDKPRISFPHKERKGSGGLVVTPALVWDPARKHDDIALSNENRCAHQPNGCKMDVYARTSVPLVARRVSYVEVQLTKVPGCYTTIGVSTDVCDYKQRLGNDAYGWGVRIYNGSNDAAFNGAVHQNVRRAFANAWLLNDRVGLLIDSTRGTMDVYRNGAFVAQAFSDLPVGVALYPTINLCHSSEITLVHAPARKFKKDRLGKFAME